jgi:stress response protein SCP2
MGSLYKKDGEWRFQAVGLGLGKAEIGNVFEQYAPGAVAHG